MDKFVFFETEKFGVVTFLQRENKLYVPAMELSRAVKYSANHYYNASPHRSDKRHVVLFSASVAINNTNFCDFKRTDIPFIQALPKIRRKLRAYDLEYLRRILRCGRNPRTPVDKVNALLSIKSSFLSAILECESKFFSQRSGSKDQNDMSDVKDDNAFKYDEQSVVKLIQDTFEAKKKSIIVLRNLIDELKSENERLKDKINALEEEKQSLSRSGEIRLVACQDQLLRTKGALEKMTIERDEALKLAKEAEEKAVQRLTQTMVQRLLTNSTADLIH